jgi:hypothetical protein
MRGRSVPLRHDRHPPPSGSRVSRCLDSGGLRLRAPAHDRIAGSTERANGPGGGLLDPDGRLPTRPTRGGRGLANPYDLTTNSISDLGVTGCGDFQRPDGSVVYACSPRHALMNAVFVVVGVLTAAGALLTRGIWPRRQLT